MSTILDKEKSLFYQGLDSKRGSNIMVNKRRIESAVMTGKLSAELKMISGDVITLTIDANQFGELIFLLGKVEHSQHSEDDK